MSKTRCTRARAVRPMRREVSDGATSGEGSSLKVDGRWSRWQYSVMRTLTFLVVTAAGALAAACGGRSDLFDGASGVTSGNANKSGASGGVTGSTGSSGTAGVGGNSGSHSASGSAGTTGGSATGGFTGDTGSGFTGGTGTGFTGSTGGFTGGTGTGFTGSTGGFTGSTGGFTGSTGGFTGGTGSGFTGSTGGFTGSTGATGSSGFFCPSSSAPGVTCPNGQPPSLSTWTATDTQCFTTFECTPDPCFGSPNPQQCEQCADGSFSCGQFTDVNGICTLEYCPPPAGSSCTPGATCATGSSCTSTASNNACEQTCVCDFGQFQCFENCGQPIEQCQPGAFCSSLGAGCQNGELCLTCVCNGTELLCSPVCSEADAGVFFPDASLAHIPQDAAPDATEILNDF